MTQPEQTGKKPILVTADSACDLTPEWIDSYGIRVIHHRLLTEEGAFEDETEIDSDELCTYLRDGKKSAKSEVPQAKELARFWEEHLREADEILHITISHQASPVFGEAKKAEKDFDRVHVFDSGDMAGGAGMFVLYAAHLAARNQTIADITDALTRFKQEIRSTYVLRGTEYLQRGGRMSSFLSGVLTAFLLHPVIVMKNDRMNFSFAWSDRYRENYIRKMLAKAKNIDPSLLVIPHSALGEEELQWVQREVERYVQFERVIPLETSAAITVNVGEGTFGLVYREVPQGSVTRRLFGFL